MKSKRWIDPNIRRYQEFMESRKKNDRSDSTGKLALFELHMDYPTHIAFGEISNLLTARGIQPIAHMPIWNPGLSKKIRFQIEKVLKFDKGLNWPFYIFRIIGIHSFVTPKINLNSLISSSKFLIKLSPRMNKQEALQLKFKGILVGDLFYDWHMNVRKLGTVYPTSIKFKVDLFKFLCAVSFWDEFISKNSVFGVFVSHTCYGQGILTRVAIKNGVKSFQITADRMYQLNEEFIYADSEFQNYIPESDFQFNYEVDIERAQKRIEALRMGAKDIDAAHALVSGYSGGEKQQIYKTETGLNCLIAAHCFSDAPHAFGPQLFPDYFEWFSAILEASKHSNNRWYARPHPAFSKDDWSIYTDLLSHYPHVTSLNLETSVTNLIKQGVDVLFTSHGTIAFEAALEGTVVIGGSSNAAFKNYSFVKIPATKEELVSIVRNIKNLDEYVIPKKEEILHYYDLHHLRSENSWLFKHRYQKFLSRVGGLRRQFTNTETFSAWLELCSSSDDLNILHDEISRFIESNEYFYKYTQTQKSQISDDLTEGNDVSG